jgi:hypothetical protein
VWGGRGNTQELLSWTYMYLRYKASMANATENITIQTLAQRKNSHADRGPQHQNAMVLATAIYLVGDLFLISIILSPESNNQTPPRCLRHNDSNQP